MSTTKFSLRSTKILPWVPEVPRSRQPTTVAVAAKRWERGWAEAGNLWARCVTHCSDGPIMSCISPHESDLTLAVWLARWKVCVSLMPLTDERTCTDKYYIHNSRKSKVWESTISRTLSFSTFWRKMSSWFSPLGRGSWSYFRRFPDLCAKLDERCIVGYHTKSILLVICLQHH